MTKTDATDANVDEQELEEVDQQDAEDETSDSQDDTSSQTDDTDQADNDDKSEFEKRYTQFAGDTPEEYIKNLEKAYENSSKEALKLKKERDDARAAKLAEVANTASDDKKDDDKAEAPSMTDLWVNQEMKRKHVEQFNKFAEKHPEVNEDDELFDKLDKETGKYMSYVLATEKRIPELDEALNWAAYKLGLQSDSKEDKVLAAAKNAGAGSKSTTASKDAPKPKFSDKQIEAARKIDASLRDKSRAEIEEILAKYK